MNKLKKIIFSSLLIVSLIVSETNTAQAIGIDSITGGVIDYVISKIFGRLDVDEGELKYFIQTFNVSRRKKQPPQVSLNFTPANPVSGQKVTAVATPTYFLNDSKELYFTWYLKSAGCNKKSNPNEETRRKCDSDGDGNIDENDYKVKAMRIIANNDFEWDKDGAYSNHTDNDGYKAIWGGDDQKGKNNHCYVHNTKTGDEYEIECNKHLFPNAPGETTGDSEFDKGEEEFWHTNPNDPDTADTGNGDEANITGLGLTSFTWNYEKGDEVGVVIEGVSVEPTQVADSSYRIMWALLNNNCETGDADTDYPRTDISDPVYSGSCTDGFGNIRSEVKTVTTVKEFIVNRAGTIATIRTRKNVSQITDANCDGQFDETAVNTPSVTCPDGEGVFDDPDNSGTNITCYAIDKVINLDDSGDNALTADKIKKVSDLNSCLDENMIDPEEGGGIAGKLEVNLDYSPQFPMNDPVEGSDGGDIMSVSSSLQNDEDTGYIRYKWEVFANDQINPESWGDSFTKSEIPEVSQTTGLNLDTFKFRLNFPEETLKKKVSDIQKFYLKVKLTAIENVGDEIREGHSDVIIPVSSTSGKIRVFDATATQSGNDIVLSPGSVEKCLEGFDKTLCPVVKNEILALQVENSGLTDFSWSVNGEAIGQITENCSWGECDSKTGENTNLAYLPILEDESFRYDVELAATDIKNGEKININKMFEVVEPQVKIDSADTASTQPVFLGNYIDLDGKEWPDYSETNFETLAYSPTKLKAIFTGFTPSTENYAWYVDGLKITKDNATDFGYNIDESGILTLPGEQTGKSYDIGILSLYSQDNLIKKILYTYWNVPYDELYEANISKSVTINPVMVLSENSGSVSAAPRSRTKMLASVFSATPQYLTFLLRIVLTSFLILVFSGIILSFFPNTKENEK